MTHRDHISLGLIVYSGTALLAQCFRFSGVLSEIGGPAPLILFAAYLGGVSFPDTDLYIWPHLRAGHRVRSPFHRFDYPIVSAIIFTLIAAFLYSNVYKYAFLDFLTNNFGGNSYLVAGIPAAFTFGWFVHLVGDFIQGGVKLGFGINKRIGFTSFKWDRYTSGWGTTFSCLLKILALIAFGFFIKTFGTMVFGGQIFVLGAVFLAIQALSMTNALKFEGALVTYALLAASGEVLGFNESIKSFKGTHLKF